DLVRETYQIVYAISMQSVITMTPIQNQILWSGLITSGILIPNRNLNNSPSPQITPQAAQSQELANTRTAKPQILLRRLQTNIGYLISGQKVARIYPLPFLCHLLLEVVEISKR